MDLLRHWPERIVAINDEAGALMEYQSLGPGDTPEPGDVEYVRADLHRGAVEALRAIAADPQLGGTGHPVDVLARTALEALGLDPTGGQS